MKVEPVVLSGHYVRLEPLGEVHIPQLALAGDDESIWKYMVYGDVVGEQRMRLWVQDMLARQRRGADLPFAVIHSDSGQAVGSTRYLDIQLEHRSVEIGGTWYAPAFQRTPVNTESKYLLLKHAFEQLGCVRVQFKTDVRNLRSQRAIERLGATREGVLRKHRINPDGYIRDSVFYSVIDDEWPAVKARLEALLAR